MKYETKELERMSTEELIQTYRKAKKSVKKDILTSLANSEKFAVLMGGLYSNELVEMARIHPYKEVIVDTMIDEMESHGMSMTHQWYKNIEHYNRKDLISYNEKREDIQKNFDDMEKALLHRNIFDRIKGTFSRKPAFPEQLPDKIKNIRKLFEMEERRNSATGKKREQLENQDLDQAVDESRVEVNNGVMAKIFDKYAKEARKAGKFMDYGEETDIARKVKTQLAEEYISALGDGKEEVARLVAMKEFESYSGEKYYIPYCSIQDFGAKPYDYDSLRTISGTKDDRGWEKNLLEVEQVQDFTVGEQNLGEVFVVKSEFSPTSYAIEGKWAPIYEYYTKNKNGEMVRIGVGKINKETGKMETSISTNKQDISIDVQYNTKELENAKKDGTVIQFDSNEYTGTKTKTSRRDIEQALAIKSIQAHLGKGKQIADITQIRDFTTINYKQSENNPYSKYANTKNAYVVSSVENGVETYELVCINEDGECESYPGMDKDLFAKKEMHFPTGMITGYDKSRSLRILDGKQALETFKSKEGLQYQAYRDKEGVLRVAQIMEHVNGNGTYAEELDTYSVMCGDIEKIKEQSRAEHDRTLTLLKVKQEEKKNDLSI